MIKTLIFDFGDVFINLDKTRTISRGKALFGKDIITEAKNNDALDIFNANNNYEKGLISTEDFVSFYTGLTKNISANDFIVLWNSLILDFPKHRLDFIKKLASKKAYKLILLSNTNDLHINYIKETVSFYDEFKNCFDEFYLSQEIHLRKPDATIFEFVLKQNNLLANECLFIDDTKDNTNTAMLLGFHVWNIDKTKEDVINLFSTKSELF